MASNVDDGDHSDRELIRRVGLFFNENGGFDKTTGNKGTIRFHTTASVLDGKSYTLMIAEKIRTAFSVRGKFQLGLVRSPADEVLFQSSHLKRQCVCVASNLNSALANFADTAINSGIALPEGESPWPNSLHTGGVSVGCADGQLSF